MCGVVGIVSKEDAAPALYEALTVIQHRDKMLPESLLMKEKISRSETTRSC